MIDIRKDIYNEKVKLERHIEAVKRSSISESNKKLILEFKDFCSALGNSSHRMGIVIRHLLMFAKYLDADFKKAKRKDIEKAISKLNESDYADWTKVMTKNITKRFYRWLYKTEDSDPAPDCIRWVRCKRPTNELKKEDLLTTEDVEGMIRSTSHLMYKALLSVLYESAMRPGELLQMRIKDIHFQENYITVYVRGKMKKSMGDRKVFLIHSYDLLLKWIENHPFRDNLDHPVWIVSTRQKYKTRDLYGKAISIEFLNQIIKKCGNNAGIKRRVFAYLFRHSRGTDLYIEMGESLAKKMMGHAPDSDMAKVYNHLNEEDVLKKLKEINGISEATKKDEVKEVCQRCHYPNSYGATICARCGLSLNVKSAMILEQELKSREEEMQTMKQLLQSLQENPEVLKMLKNPEFIEQQAEIKAKKMFEDWVKKQKTHAMTLLNE